MPRIAIIPAKRFSRRLPHKNFRIFRGKPMLAYPIEAARESRLFDRIYVSTEDGHKVGPLATSLGARVLYRPHRMIDSRFGTQEICGHVLKQMGADVADEVCCIYPATPLLSPFDLRAAYDWWSVFGPRYAYVTGWFYWGNAFSFMRYPELDERGCLDQIVGGRHVDINTPEDLARVEEILSEASSPSTSCTRRTASLT